MVPPGSRIVYGLTVSYNVRGEHAVGRGLVERLTVKPR
jgi:hypothetical protein